MKIDNQRLGIIFLFLLMAGIISYIMFGDPSRDMIPIAKIVAGMDFMVIGLAEKKQEATQEAEDE
jgi:hypothetical protein